MIKQLFFIPIGIFRAEVSPEILRHLSALQRLVVAPVALGAEGEYVLLAPEAGEGTGDKVRVWYSSPSAPDAAAIVALIYALFDLGTYCERFRAFASSHACIIPSSFSGGRVSMPSALAS